MLCRCVALCYMCGLFLLQKIESVAERRSLIAEQDVQFQNSLITDSEKVNKLLQATCLNIPD